MNKKIALWNKLMDEYHADEIAKKVVQHRKEKFKGKEPIELRDCPDCDAEPGQPHINGCDVERCSVCGGQKLCCDCDNHDPLFSRWTGIWPGRLEADALCVDLNDFYAKGYHKIFFIKMERENEYGK